MKIRTAKTILWFLFGAGLTVIILRIINGPGSVVALSDLIPWGLWKGGGVVALVPIGGAGFTLAAFVYVFHWEKYRPLALGAVLLGLMCYSSVALGLTFDIGIWWRIVFPLAFWQFHSTLFEIAWCIMLYLGVLAAEFSHVVFDKYRVEPARKFLHKFGIVFVIAGIALSTLHQSSLGTLFLATPYRLHPLWHTDLLPFFFFVTAVGLGCLSISFVTIVTHRLYEAKPPMEAISGLARISSIVLLFYMVAKFAEIIIAKEASLLIQPVPDTLNFWIEMLFSALIPGMLLLRRSFRESEGAVFWIGLMALLGVSLNRINVAGLATVSSTHSFYLPSWTEWTVTIGILAGAALIFFYLVERFEVFPQINGGRVKDVYAPGAPNHAIWKSVYFQSPGSELRMYSASFVVSAGIVFGLVPEQAVFGVQPEQTAVVGPRIVKGSHPAERQLRIDGNRDGKFVLFDHDRHVERQPGGAESCVRCHHMRKPAEEVSKCADCHRDMYLAVDIFRHDEHVKIMGGNSSCIECHTDPLALKVRENTKPCAGCHNGMRPEGTLIAGSHGERTTIATGYMDAMHGLCVECHQQEKKNLTEKNDDFDRCSTCHGSPNGF